MLPTLFHTSGSFVATQHYQVVLAHRSLTHTPSLPTAKLVQEADGMRGMRQSLFVVPIGPLFPHSLSDASLPPKFFLSSISNSTMICCTQGSFELRTTCSETCRIQKGMYSRDMSFGRERLSTPSNLFPRPRLCPPILCTTQCPSRPQGKPMRPN